jgi:ABC-type Fe3+-hydroxamate transport system substrate-binding protein
MRRNTENQISVEIQRLWESTIQLNLDEDTTVGDALAEAGLPRNAEARIGWELATENDLLDDGDVIVVATKKNTQG